MLADSPLLKQFKNTLALSPTELETLSGIPMRLLSLKTGEPIVRRGDRSTSCILVVEGMLASSKVVADGNRQITAVHIAGDFPDLMSLHLECSDSDIRSVARSEVASISHEHLRRISLDHPAIGAKLWRTTLVDAAVSREWVVNLGQRQALSRMAHILCEISFRMKRAGLVEGSVCDMPLTQINLSEVTGMSLVHVNRMLQELRRRRLINLTSGRLDVLNWAALVKVADFTEDYLH